jgi:DNA-binding transcriptional regulator YdaS (Cro superfamily)
MGIEQQIDSPLAEAVRLAGGQSSFARLVDRNQSTVFDWLKADKPLPAELCKVVCRATGLPRWRLRPDLFEPDHSSGMPVGGDAVAFDPAANPNGDRA